MIKNLLTRRQPRKNLKNKIILHQILINNKKINEILINIKKILLQSTSLAIKQNIKHYLRCQEKQKSNQTIESGKKNLKCEFVF